MRISEKTFKNYLNLQKSGVVNMVSREVTSLIPITREEQLFIIKNYEELYDRYEKRVFAIDGVKYPINAAYQSEERCLMDGYELVKDDIYFDGESIAIIEGYN